MASIDYLEVIEVKWDNGFAQRIVEPGRMWRDRYGLEVGESVECVATGDGSHYTLTRLPYVWAHTWYEPGNIPCHRELEPHELNECGRPIH